MDERHFLVSSHREKVLEHLFVEETLQLGPFGVFGFDDGLEHLAAFSLATQSRANAQGVKSERKNHRKVRASSFYWVEATAEVVARLFPA